MRPHAGGDVMLTFAQGLRKAGAAGEPLPTVFKALERMGLVFRRGQFALIAAGPGTGKSALALTLGIRTGSPTFYFSADSDAWTQYVRGAAIVTGWTTQQAEEAIRNGDTSVLDAALAYHSRVRMCYEASPTMQDIEDELTMYAHVYGWPALVVIDNITNVVNPNGVDGHQGLEEICDYLHALARLTGACVIALHHVTGPHNDGTSPIPLSGLKGQIGRVPEIVLTLHRGGDEVCGLTINVSPVKNRGGKADASGYAFASLQWTPDSMRLVG